MPLRSGDLRSRPAQPRSRNQATYAEARRWEFLFQEAGCALFVASCDQTALKLEAAAVPRHACRKNYAETSEPHQSRIFCVRRAINDSSFAQQSARAGPSDAKSLRTSDPLDRPRATHTAIVWGKRVPRLRESSGAGLITSSHQCPKPHAFLPFLPSLLISHLLSLSYRLFVLDDIPLRHRVTMPQTASCLSNL